MPRGDLFVGDQARNNGLDATVTDAGAGDGRFKTGSLRNVALTAPYMHDGRFETLDQVVGTTTPASRLAPISTTASASGTGSRSG